MPMFNAENKSGNGDTVPAPRGGTPGSQTALELDAALDAVLNEVFNPVTPGQPRSPSQSGDPWLAPVQAVSGPTVDQFGTQPSQTLPQTLQALFQSPPQSQSASPNLGAATIAPNLVLPEIDRPPAPKVRPSRWPWVRGGRAQQRSQSRSSSGATSPVLAWLRLGQPIMAVAAGAAAIAAAGLTGVAIATRLPAPAFLASSSLEGVFEPWDGITAALQRLPKRAVLQWADALQPPPRPEAQQALLPELTASSRQQLGTELVSLRQQLQQLQQRTSNLEAQLGYRYGGATLDQRLQAIDQRLADPRAATLAPPQPLGPATEPLTVTLPSDALFADAQAELRSEALAVLDNVLTELKRYPDGAIVTLAVHTDSIGSPATNLDLSLRRAREVATYFSRHLGPTHRFLPIGYGASQPLVRVITDDNSSAKVDQQRNRRLEIRVQPKSVE